jgi:uncharacterized membrane protein
MKKQKSGIPEMAKIVERNIEALLKRRKQEDDRKPIEGKIADSIARFTGSMTFVYIHLVFFGIWIFWNVGLFGLEAFDPSFVVLAMFASVEAIFLSTFVLISQNRLNDQAEKRAELDLQVSLLTEHEITRLLNLVALMAKKMDISEAWHEDLEELSKDVHPEKVMDTMDKIVNEKSDKKT